MTANYREVFQPETVAKIDSLVGKDYDLDYILEFINEYSEYDFVDYYEKYVKYGDEYGYSIVDAFLTRFDLESLDLLPDSYYGWFDSPATFAEERFEDELRNFPSCIVVDWEETAKALLEYDFSRVDDYYFLNL